MFSHSTAFEAKQNLQKATVLCENSSSVLHMEDWEELLRVWSCHCHLLLWLCNRAFPAGEGSRRYRVTSCKPG